ncbi:hypothetical protein [Streptomyces sp. SudanB52_2052]|uniref:hypothetical protein n=1 Tax=Streptomyces sp. SudanB52_2052 TaxID=3035276 RepID=UPI003F55B71B
MTVTAKRSTGRGRRRRDYELVDWPFAPLWPLETALVGVRVQGKGGSVLRVERGF